MDLKELEYFKMVCEQKSITKAAHALYMTPQGLSRIIKNIENENGSNFAEPDSFRYQSDQIGRVSL